MKSNTRKIWIITDTHFNHTEKMIEVGRPEDYEKRLFDNLREISENDILIHLGDICIGNDFGVHNTFINRLKCKKILVKGNHDRKSNNWYLNNGWDFVCHKFSDNFFGKYIVFSHKPRVLTEEEPYDLNIHGHFHDSDHRSQEPELLAIKNDKQLLVSVELTNYKPLLLKNIVEAYDKTNTKTNEDEENSNQNM